MLRLSLQSSLRLIGLVSLCLPWQAYGMTTSFVEFHERLENFRRIPMNSSLHSFGVDINSTGDVNFHPALILGEALSPEAKLLTDYTAALGEVRQAIEEYANKLPNLLLQHRQSSEQERKEQVEANLRLLISRHATVLKVLLDVLQDDPGIPRQKKEDVLSQPEPNYRSVTELIAQRIVELQQKILSEVADGSTNDGSRFLLSAYCLHIAVTGAADTIHLPNYDQRISGGIRMAQHISVGSLDVQAVTNVEREARAIADLGPNIPAAVDILKLETPKTTLQKEIETNTENTKELIEGITKVAYDDISGAGIVHPAALAPSTFIQIPRTTRQENDIYELYVAILKDSVVIYSDEFDFRVDYYGWRTTATGALAFTLSAENGGMNRFTPATCGSVLFHYRRRPDPTHANIGGGGILGNLLDAGLGFHAIIYSQAEQIQYGIGSSFTLFQDILHFGAGFNLQRSHRAGYVLVGIKLLEIRDKGGKVEPPKSSK